jgi:long-chain acyl-CoA synthetase
MELDIELYRREVPLACQPPLQLSAIDIKPEPYDHTLVFIHGFGGQARQWRYQLQHFSFRHRVVALDLQGHGRTPHTDRPLSMQTLVEDVRQAVRGLGVQEPFYLLGHSFGGAVAAEFAHAYPDMLRGLVLIATAGEFTLNPLYRFALNLPLPILRALQPMTRGWLSASPVALRPWYHQVLSRWSGWSLLRSVVVPTLVIRGHHDRVYSRPMYEEVARSIPGAQDVDVGASGHMVMLERRQAVNRAIEGFIQGEPRIWRDDPPAEMRPSEQELKERPWLAHYEPEVPPSVAIPDVPAFQLLRSAVRRYPGRTALIFEGARLSYAQLNRRVNRMANALRSLGMERGDRLLLMLPNCPQLVIAYFGTLKAAGVVVFALPAHQPQELLRQARDSGARFAVVERSTRRLWQPLLDEGQLKVLMLANPLDDLPLLKRLWRKGQRKARAQASRTPLDQRAIPLLDLLRRHSPAPPQVEVEALDPAVIQYTGGTTTSPKGVVLTHRNLVANTIQTRHWIPEAREGQERFLCVLPFSHSYGMTTALNVPIALGATLMIKARFEPREVLETIRRYKPTIFPAVPQMYMALSHYPGVRKYGIQSVRACLSGAAPLPVEVQEAFEKLTRGRLVEGYGLTEASPVTHANPLRGRRKMGSIGIPLPSTQARIVSLTDPNEPLPPGQVGELAVRGPQVMAGYWGNPQATAKVLTADGWLLTGDVAQMDADGYFRIIARKADMWYPGKPDKPAFPRDVEEVLYEVPQVREAAVVAIARQPIAFVISSDPDLKAETLIAYCRRRLPPELAPRAVIFVEDFPRTFIGKVIRRELAKRYAQQREAI